MVYDPNTATKGTPLDQRSAVPGDLENFPTVTPDVTTPNQTAPAPTSNLTADQQSAKALIDEQLGQYGLASLGSFAWNEFLNGTPISQIMLDIRGTPEYKARFPAMQALAQAGHAINEQTYIDYERNATSLMVAAGLPSGFYDQPDDFTALLTGNVALPELKTRLDAYQTLAFQSPPEVRQAMQDFYGVSADGMLTAFMIDPERALPIIQKDVAAAQAGGYAQSTGYGALTREQAEGLAALGLNPDQYQTGFGNLAKQQQAIQGLPGQGLSPISTDTALAAQFGGNAAAQQEIENRQLQLLAPNKAGGQVATSQQGAVGAGVAQ